MPSLIDIRRRIRSVKNTQQITRAMKLVSAAKLRRAQDRVLAARPYADILRNMLANVAAAAGGDDGVDPLLTERPEQRIQVILITSDRGLAGAFNSNTIRAAQRFLTEHRDAQVEFELVGRKGREFFRRRNAAVSAEFGGLVQNVKYPEAADIARRVAERFRREEIDAVYLIYSEFKSVLAPQLVSAKILPVAAAPNAEATTNYIYEQPPAEILAALLPRYVEIQVYRALIESVAAEHAARMTAMESATKNSGEVIDRLTLNMNRVRQASITKEIIEVVSGAAAAG